MYMSAAMIARVVARSRRWLRNAKRKHTLSYCAAHSSMRNLRIRKPLYGEPYRGFESHLSANFFEL